MIHIVCSMIVDWIVEAEKGRECALHGGFVWNLDCTSAKRRFFISNWQIGLRLSGRGGSIIHKTMYRRRASIGSVGMVQQH